MKALKMKNPPHPGFSVRVDCLGPHQPFGLASDDSVSPDRSVLGALYTGKNARNHAL